MIYIIIIIIIIHVYAIAYGRGCLTQRGDGTKPWSTRELANPIAPFFLGPKIQRAQQYSQKRVRVHNAPHLQTTMSKTWFHILGWG